MVKILMVHMYTLYWCMFLWYDGISAMQQDLQKGWIRDMSTTFHHNHSLFSTLSFMYAQNNVRSPERLGARAS